MSSLYLWNIALYYISLCNACVSPELDRQVCFVASRRYFHRNELDVIFIGTTLQWDYVSYIFITTLRCGSDI